VILRAALRWVAALPIALVPATATADIVTDCDNWVSPAALVEPWEKTSRTFSRGSVRVAVVDLGEPDCCPLHVIVLMPADMYGGRVCGLVARNALIPNGWARIGIEEAEATRDGEPGLKLSIPVYSYDARTGGADPDSRRVIELRVRQAAGTIELETE
jgi:hypothetical protein